MDIEPTAADLIAEIAPIMNRAHIRLHAENPELPCNQDHLSVKELGEVRRACTLVMNRMMTAAAGVMFDNHFLESHNQRAIAARRAQIGDD